MPDAAGARKEALPYAHDAGRGEAGEDQFTEPGDAYGIHGAIAKGAQGVVDGKLDYKQASILGYFLQLALSNVKHVKFEDEPTTD